MGLSLAAKSLWGKTSGYSGSDVWLPLYMHMSDSAEIAKLLWDEWIPEATRKIVFKEFLYGDLRSEFIEMKDIPGVAKSLFVFLAAAHDVGKAIPAFQILPVKLNSEIVAEIEATGLLIPGVISDPKYKPHPLASQMILERNGIDLSLAVVLGGHHGRPPSKKEIDDFDARKNNTGFGSEVWIDVQDELLNYALELADLDDFPQGRISVPAQVVLSGLVIMTDWLASDSEKFHLVRKRDRIDSSFQRAVDAWSAFDLPPCWDVRLEGDSAGLYAKRFENFREIRPIQRIVADTLEEVFDPGIVIIEAPMGEGKTEAALVTAEIIAAKTGSGGLYFALPTQATSDGIFSRIHNWVEKLSGDENIYSIFLAHGKAGLNEEYKGIKTKSRSIGDPDEEDGGVIANDWLSGRKKGMLSDFAVGTIDQVLFMALKMRHLALRHLAIVNKIIVIDECHAYDTYMNQYLIQALKWLGAYKVPVIILSATLPSETRRKLIHAYQGGDSIKDAENIPSWRNGGQDNAVSSDLSPWMINRAYPLLTYTDGMDIKQTEIEASARSAKVKIAYLDDADVEAKLSELLVFGGCAAVICDTVGRAQEKYERVRAHFGEKHVKLVHSRFLSMDRAEKEKELVTMLGPQATLKNGERPKKLIVVGTQVLEQSLDIDFDVMISDLAPMDLLIQRIGRLHRHSRENRPENLKSAQCYITGVESLSNMKFEEAIEKIYPRYLLMNTVELLTPEVSIPSDISDLVQCAYDKKGIAVPETLREKYLEAKQEHEFLLRDKERRAKAFRIGEPNGGAFGNLVGWLDVTQGDAGDKEAEASVRDTVDSIEVIVLMQNEKEELMLLPWIAALCSSSGMLRRDHAPDERTAEILAACTVRLPLRSDWQIGIMIRELESANYIETWQSSRWLKGELLLILDKNLEAAVGSYKIVYNQETGLHMKYENKEKKNER